jgi:hypothetical protein
MAHLRRYLLSVSDSGAPTSPVYIGNEPNCAGWELSWHVRPADSAFVTTALSVKDEWEDGPDAITIGFFATGVGGKLFVPYPSVSLLCKDQDAPAAGNSSTVKIVARPVMCDGHSGADSIVYGWESAPIDAGASQDFDAPDAAQWYKVTQNGAGGPFLVSVNQNLGGGETTLSKWKILETGTSNPNEGGERWSELGMPDCTINVKNEHGADATSATVWWKFDLRKLK